MLGEGHQGGLPGKGVAARLRGKEGFILFGQGARLLRLENSQEPVPQMYLKGMLET